MPKLQDVNSAWLKHTFDQFRQEYAAHAPAATPRPNPAPGPGSPPD
ncbi:MAG: hypothetical protein U0835_16045 [Isosphaeraceae bacterium]